MEKSRSIAILLILTAPHQCLLSLEKSQDTLIFVSQFCLLPTLLPTPLSRVLMPRPSRRTESSWSWRCRTTVSPTGRAAPRHPRVGAPRSQATPTSPLPAVAEGLGESHTRWAKRHEADLSLPNSHYHDAQLSSRLLSKESSIAQFTSLVKSARLEF